MVMMSRSAREVVSRILKNFERKGLVRLGRGKITVLHRAGLEAIETRRTFELTDEGGEPNLGKRGLYATVGGGTPGGGAADFLAVLAYADGEHDLDDIAEIHGKDVAVIERAAETLITNGLVRTVS